MNEVALKLKSSLTCINCSKIFKVPIELPCGDLICQEHLHEKEVVQKNKIKCLNCKQEFQIKDNEFNFNKLAHKLIDNNIYLNEEEIALKQKIKDSIKMFYEMYDEFLLSKNKLDLDCHNHFQEIRFQLDMHREKLKEKIDDIYMEMIEKTKEFESSYLQSFGEKLENSFLTVCEIKSSGEHLKDLEEKLRNPNIMIESIREIQLKQENDIKSIQFKLNEIKQIKQDLKKSNNFKPNIAFDHDLFGQLNLNEYSGFDNFQSQILTRNQPLELLKLCELNQNDKFKLLYRASENGFGPNDFHSKCDGHANTLTILEANGFIYGGFTTVSWEKICGFKSDQNAFLFSLTNKDNQPCKMKIDPNKYQKAIYCSSDLGPIFGDGFDIFIDSNANKNMNSYSSLSSTYRHLQYNFGTTEAKSFFAGSYQFQLSEIEVYQLE